MSDLLCVNVLSASFLMQRYTYPLNKQTKTALFLGIFIKVFLPYPRIELILQKRSGM